MNPSNQNYIVSWHPYNPSIFSLVTSSSVSAFIEVGQINDEKIDMVHSFSKPFGVCCMDWHPNSNDLFLAYGTIAGSVNLIDLTHGRSELSLNTGFISKKQCNIITWNQTAPFLLAAGFENTKRFGP